MVRFIPVQDILIGMSSETHRPIEVSKRDWELVWFDESIVNQLDTPPTPDDYTSHVPYFAVGAVRDHERGLGRTDVLYVSADGERVVNSEFTLSHREWDSIWGYVWVPEDADSSETPENFVESAERALELHAKQEYYDELLEKHDTSESCGKDNTTQE
jgi:hypothetical protein